MVARPAAAIFTVTPVDPPAPSVRMLHGANGPSMPAEATWTVHDRPRRKGAIEFTGFPPRVLTVDAALSYADVDQSVEILLFEVERTLLWPTGPFQEPPVVRIQGPGVPPMIQMLTWVCTKMTSDPSTEERNDDGTRNLVWFTLEFLENSRASVILSTAQSQAQAAAERAQATPPAAVSSGASTDASPTPSSATYTVKSGDTLSAIATRELGNVNRWHDIADLNNIRDPKKLTVGQVLRMPT